MHLPFLCLFPSVFAVVLINSFDAAHLRTADTPNMCASGGANERCMYANDGSHPKCKSILPSMAPKMGLAPGITPDAHKIDTNTFGANSTFSVRIKLNELISER